MGKESIRVDICTCVTDSLCCTAETEHCKTKLVKILKINKFVCEKKKKNNRIAIALRFYLVNYSCI